MYKLRNLPLGGNDVQRIEDGTFIPFDPANKDYQAYLAWLSEGNEPLPADPPPIVQIASVTMRQARLALLGAGLLDDVEAALAAIPDESQRQAAQIEWEYAQEVHRDHQWVQNLAGTLGLDADDLDALFTQAASL